MAEISQLLDNAWKNFVEFYDKQCLSLGGGGQLVCWKEIDVMGHLMRFLFEEFKNKKVNNIEIHLNCSLKQQNYSNESFVDSLKLLQKHFRGHRIEPDMVIVKDNEYLLVLWVPTFTDIDFLDFFFITSFKLDL